MRERQAEEFAFATSEAGPAAKLSVSRIVQMHAIIFGTMRVGRLRNPNPAAIGTADQSAPRRKRLDPGGVRRARRHAEELFGGSGVGTAESLSEDAGEASQCVWNR